MISTLALPAFDQNTPENEGSVNFFASQKKGWNWKSRFIYTLLPRSPARNIHFIMLNIEPKHCLSHRTFSLCSIWRVIRNHTTLGQLDVFHIFHIQIFAFGFTHHLAEPNKSSWLTIIFRRFLKFNSYGVNWLNLITWSSSTTNTRHCERRYSFRLNCKIKEKSVSVKFYLSLSRWITKP